MTAEERAANRLIASFHEAGHVVVGDALGIPWKWAAVPEYQFGHTRFDAPDNCPPQASPEDLSALGWAGVVAGHLVLAQRSRGRCPRPDALWRDASDSDKRYIADDRRAGVHLRRAFEILTERWDVVEAVANALEEDGYVWSGSQLPLPGPTGAVKKFTAKQGQYLAFIHTYTRLNGRAPAEADMQQYFRVTPPSVHQMILTLEKKSLITREPGAARSIRVLVPPKDLPALGE